MNPIAIAVVSILISYLFVSVGCSPGTGYVSVDARSALMTPTFCMHADPDFRGRLDIGTIIVRKAKRSAEEERGSELDSLLEKKDLQKVWHLQYKSFNFFLFNFINGLLGRQPKSPIPCLIYGEVPPGYEEEMKALPLEPEELYTVWMEEHNSPRYIGDLRFIIRLNETGIPERLEYLSEVYIFDNTPYYLKLY